MARLCVKFDRKNHLALNFIHLPDAGQMAAGLASIRPDVRIAKSL
jgi:hypothetical protein